jgi:capsular polysaccharide transport system permease protein
MTTPDDPTYQPPRQRRSPTGQVLTDLGGRLRGIGGSRPFLAYMVLVGLAAAIYYFFVAAPVYVSNTSYSVRGRQQMQQPTVIATITGGAGSTDLAEISEVADFVKSPEMLAQLEKRLKLRAHYSAPRLDPFNRLSPKASNEDFLRFYRKMVLVRPDRESFITRIEVRAFDAKTANAVANAILQISADYVDGLSTRIRNDTLRTAERELLKAENDVRQTRLNLTRYRASTGLVNPSTNASATGSTIHSLEQNLLSANAELAQLTTYSTENAPQVRQVRARIAELRRQIAAEQQRLASSSQPNTIANRLYEYEGLEVQSEYAEKRLVAALEAYDQARAIANQRERFLVPVVTPNYPDSPTLPNRILNFLETVLIAAALYAIVALAIAGVRDHQGI